MVEATRRVRFVVEGRVQGVGFRAFTRRAAHALGLSGFVQNRADGRVEGEAEGPPDAVASLLQQLERGSAIARVRSVDVEERTPQGELGFEVRR